MTESENLKSKATGATTYAAPTAIRLADAAAASGNNCYSGTGARSRCETNGSDAQACVTGNGTYGHGECNTGYNAGNCTTDGQGVW